MPRLPRATRFKNPEKRFLGNKHAQYLLGRSSKYFDGLLKVLLNLCISIERQEKFWKHSTHLTIETQIPEESIDTVELAIDSFGPHVPDENIVASSPTVVQTDDGNGLQCECEVDVSVHQFEKA